MKTHRFDDETVEADNPYDLVGRWCDALPLLFKVLKLYFSVLQKHKKVLKL